MLRIAIGLPTNRLIKPKTAQSLLELVNQTKYDVEAIVSTKGYNCAENRNYIAAQAVKGKYDYLFHVDDDMIYAPDTLDRLVAHDKDIIGGLYKTKYPEKQDYVIEHLDGATVRENEVFECKALGTGLLLVKTEVYKKTPQPWYGYEWFDNGMVKESVDWIFCKNASRAGFKVFCDPTVKAEHIGIYEY